MSHAGRSLSVICIRLTGLLCAGLAADSEATETDLGEELPLCCCRMETPNIRGGLSALDQTCMAMEGADGMVKAGLMKTLVDLY